MLHFFAAVLFLSAFLLPNHYFPWAAFYSDFLMGLSLACLLLVTFWRQGRKPLMLPALAAFLLLVVFIPVMQIAGGLIYFSADGWLTSLYLLAFLFSYIVGCCRLGYDSREEAARYLAGIILACALFSVGIALCQWLSVYPSIWMLDVPDLSPPFANIGQPNNLATLLAMGLMSLAYLLTQNVVGKISSIIIALPILFALALSESRTGMAFMIFIVGWWLWKGRKLQVLEGRTLCALAVIYMCFFLVIPGWTDSIYFDTNTGLQINSELGVRRVLWESLLAAVWQKPWFGYGWGQVSVAQLHVAQSFPGSVFTEHSHNLLVDILVWNGLPLGLILLGFLAYWGWSRVTKCANGTSWYLLCVVGLLMVHSMLEFPLEYLYFLIPFGLFMGLVDGVFPHKRTFRCPLLPLASLAVVAMVAMVVVFQEYRVLEKDHQAMRFQSARIFGAEPGASFQEVRLLDHQREFIRFALFQAKPGMSDDEVEWMRKVAYRYAYPPALFRLFLALALNEKPDEACVVLQKLKNLNSEELYDEAVNNIVLMRPRYPELETICGIP